jgi:multidrug efflux pump subunit AcrA (membrane-fusion protein)
MSGSTVSSPGPGPDPGSRPGQATAGGPQLGRRLLAGLALAAVASLAVAAVLIGGVGGSGTGTGSSGGSGSGEGPAATVPPVVIVDEIVADGVAVPAKRVELASETGGTIEAVPVELGERVAAGDELVVLDGTAIAAQVVQAERAVEAANARRSQAEAVVAQAQAQVDVAEANLDGATAALETARDANTREDEAVAARDAARAQVRVARAALQAAQDASAAAAADAGASEAALQAASDRLAERTITAPFAGVVASVPVGVGQAVQPGQVLVRLGDPSSWEFIATELDEGGIARVRPGAPATVVLDGLPGVSIPGTVARVGSFGQVRQGGIVYEVVVVPTGEVPDGVAWNMTATISIAADE